VVDGKVVEVGWQGRSCLVGDAGSCELPSARDDDRRPG
jgi:hypothetical protein